MKYIVFVIAFFVCSQMVASDTLKIKKNKIVSLKSNLAILLMRGFSLETEFVLNKKTGFWTEAAYHYEEHSVYDATLRETALVAGLNRYSLFKSFYGKTRTHNGMYIGPYLKFKNGYYCTKGELDYSALFLGLQAGMQAFLKENIIFSMGMGGGAGYFTRKHDLPFKSLFDRYNLPIMDFRANVCLGFMF